MKRSSEALVGVVIVAALVLITFGTLWLQGVALRGQQTEVVGEFPSVGQIKSGNAVKMRGMNIGRVREIRLAEDGQSVLVVLRIQDDIDLPPDPVVILSPESLFGDWQAEIVPRDRFAAYRFSEPSDPAFLPGYALPDISQLTATADRISETIEELTERVGIAFSEETAQNIASLIDNVEAVTERLSDLVTQQAMSFTDVTDEAQRATQEIRIAAERIRETFQTMGTLLEREELISILGDFAVVAENARTLSVELEDTNRGIRDMAVRADSTFAELGSIMALARDGDGSIARLLRDPDMAQEVESTLQSLRLLLDDIRENPRRYLRLSIF